MDWAKSLIFVVLENTFIVFHHQSSLCRMYLSLQLGKYLSSYGPDPITISKYQWLSQTLLISVNFHVSYSIYQKRLRKIFTYMGAKVENILPKMKNSQVLFWKSFIPWELPSYFYSLKEKKNTMVGSVMRKQQLIKKWWVTSF